MSSGMLPIRSDAMAEGTLPLWVKSLAQPGTSGSPQTPCRVGGKSPVLEMML